MNTLRLIHFNDLHGRLAGVAPDALRPVFSRIAGLVKQARAEVSEPAVCGPAVSGPADAGVLVLAGGDDLVGSPFAELAGTPATQFVCHPAYRLYSALGVDACVIGNHDLDWGLEWLTQAAAQDAAFPLLSANLRPAAPAESRAILPSVILPAGGLRVGVIGLTTPGEIKRPAAGEFYISDPLAAVLDALPALRGRCDLVILLSHLGYSADDRGAVMAGMGDRQLAAALPPGAVTLIVGGHTHTVLNEHGLVAENVVNGVTIVQAGSDGRFVGDVLVEVGTEGARVLDPRLWPVADLPADPAFDAEHVFPLARPVQRLLAEPLGVVTPHVDLSRAHIRYGFEAGESALANFLAGVLAARCRAAGLPVDFAFVDASAVVEGLPQAGALTYANLFHLSPFADSIVLLHLPPAALPAFLDDNARRIRLPDGPRADRGFLHFSREVRYCVALPPDLARPGGANAAEPLPARARIHAVDAEIAGQPLAAAAGRSAPLLVAHSSFARQRALKWEQEACGAGLETVALEAWPHEVTGLAVRAELVAYVRQMGGITQAGGLVRDGRLAVVAVRA